MLEKENHGNGHTTSNDLWCRKTWSLTNLQKSELAVAQRSMERAMLGIIRKDKVRNEQMTAKTKVEDITEEAEKSKVQCARHLARMNPNRWARKVTEWTPRQGKRRSGRPKRGGEMKSSKKLVPGGCRRLKTGTSGKDCGGHLPAVA